MGCDYFADQEGVFEAVIEDDARNEIARVRLDDVEPGQAIYRSDTEIENYDVGDADSAYRVSVVRGRER